MDQTRLYQLEDYISRQMINELNTYITTNIKWNWKIPGGQLRYHPPRKVNSIGTGAPVTSDGKLLDNIYGWDKTYYTASQNNSNISLETKSERLPSIFCKVIPYLRKMFRESYHDAVTTDFSFVIAVCNNYTEPEHNISPHTDDNRWYPWECSKGPVLASLSLYPSGLPEKDEEYANFQVRKNKGDRWETIRMPHNSILIMPTNLEHRVTKVKKNVKFRQRINITFRSIFPTYLNPMMNAMAVSNHNRYYRNPSVILCDASTIEKAKEVKEIYDKFLNNNEYLFLKIIVVPGKKNNDKKKLYKEYQSLEKKYRFNITKNQSIIVIETVRSVLKWINNNTTLLNRRNSVVDFCESQTQTNYDKMGIGIRKIFVMLSQYCIDNDIGNLEVASKVLKLK